MAMTQAELARQLGIAPPMVSRYKARGMPVHDVEAARLWRAQHVNPRVQTRTASAAGTAHSLEVALRPAAPPASPAHDVADLATERARLAKAQRVAQEMRNAITRGEYAPVSYLAEVLATVCAELAHRLEALPAEIRRACPQLPPEAVDRLTAAVARARNALADEVAKAAERAAADSPFNDPAEQEGKDE